ncbi:hypothetical protein NM688_g5011 [Phlebia brevispora]|uniref:Uncharacterized protein n=1 Tax=Phlebia brevispora TaxID=194682 RepID=A0ACC1T119_9APHY|nr:hypothetical protein NM688_g5011 [Phlebia brevispora]
MNNLSYTENPFASTHSLDTNPFDDPTPKTAASSASKVDTRLEEIEQRERDLERRELELNQRAEYIRKHGRNNWPPCMSLRPPYRKAPMLIAAQEIPQASQPLITRLYQLWLVLIGTLVLNMVACIIILASGGSGGGSDLGSSIGYLFVIPPLAFLLWYRPIYNGYMKEQALYYYLYFFFGGWHLAFTLYMFIGIPATGGAGLINMIKMFIDGHLAAGIVTAISAAAWAVEGLGNALYYRQIWYHRKAAGHTFAKRRNHESDRWSSALQHARELDPTLVLPARRAVTSHRKLTVTSERNMISTSDQFRMSSRDAIKDELAGRLHFNDESVLTRLGIDRISADLVEACYFGLMNDSTHSARFSELRDTVIDAEDEYGEIRWPKAIMYPILEYTLNYIGYYEWDGIHNGPVARSRHFLRCSDEDLASEAHTPGFPNINPGLVLLDSETPIIESQEGDSVEQQRTFRYSLEWRYRAGFVVVKPTSFEGPMSPEGGPMADIVLRAADYARLHMTARPFQLFSVGLLIYGLKFCVVIFDHGGATFSREGNLDTPNGWKLFVRIVRCLAVTMTDEDLGRDPTVEVLPSNHAAIPRLREEAHTLGVDVSDSCSTFSVSLGDGTGRRWATIAMIWSSVSLIGRGTVVWLVQELKDGVPEGTVKVMKTAWRSSRRMSEADIYRSVQNAQDYRGHPCVARLYAGGDVKSRDGPHISVSSLRAIILQDEPIWEYESEEMLIRGIRAAVQGGHRFLYESGILHRDVSAGNVLLAQYPQTGAEGFITDLDYAWTDGTSAIQAVPHNGSITGTYQFLSTRILHLMSFPEADDGPSNLSKIFRGTELRDDLESFVWVFCYAVMRYHVAHYPRDVQAQERFNWEFGRSDPDSIKMSRASCGPIHVMPFFRKSLSAQLLQWFDDPITQLYHSRIWNLMTGFNFTYETLDGWLDTALSAVLDV